jgi:hypothetical protein
VILIHARVNIGCKPVELYDDIEEFIENRPEAPKAKYFKDKIETGKEQVKQFQERCNSLNISCTTDFNLLIEPNEDFEHLSLLEHKSDLEVIEGEFVGKHFYKMDEGETPAYVMGMYASRENRSQLCFWLRFGVRKLEKT